MKRILYGALLLSVVTGCKKMMDKPQYDTGSTVITKPASPDDSKLVTSLQITPVTYNPQEQRVTANVDGTQLNLIYNEQAQLLIDAARYKSAWYVIFKEDFTDTQLADFDYTTTLAWGATAENWSPDNLKQMTHTETDTTIAGVNVVNVKFKRIINFYKKYETREQAIEKMNALVGKKEAVKFLTRYQPDADTLRYAVTKLNVVYTK